MVHALPRLTAKRLKMGLLALLGLSLGMIAIGPRLRAQRQVSQDEVQAVLQRCSQCHGPSLQMSKLDLSTREGMLKGGEKGPALVPGDAQASALYRRVAGLQTPAMPMKPVAPVTNTRMGKVSRFRGRLQISWETSLPRRLSW